MDSNRIRTTAGGVVDALALVAMALSMALVFSFDYGRDQAIYAVIAREMLQGAMPYRDVVDFKPPGIHLIYAASRLIVGGEHWCIRLVECLSMLCCVAGLVVLSKRTFKSRRIGLVSGAFYCLGHAQGDFWHTAQPESFGAAFVVWGLVCASFGVARDEREANRVERRRLLAWFAAGLLFGFCALLKPPLAGGGLLLALLAGLRRWPGPVDWRRRLVPLVGFGSGASLPIALVGAWFLARGAWGDLYQVLFVFTPTYTKLGWQLGWAYNCRRLFDTWLSLNSNLIWSGIVLLAVFRPRSGEWRVVGSVLVLLGVQLAGILWQAKFFPYHYGATYPLTSLLAVLGWARAIETAERRSPALVLAAFRLGIPVVFLLVALTPRWRRDLGTPFTLGQRLYQLGHLVAGRGGRQALRDRMASMTGAGDAEQNRVVSNYLANRLPADSPLFVWGFEPVLYDLTGLPIASRYIYDVLQRAPWAAEASRRILMEDLARRPPGAIVVEHGDSMNLATGSAGDSYGALQHFRALSILLETSYRFEARGGNLDIYVRKDVPRREKGP